MVVSASILEQVIEPAQGTLPREAAAFLLTLDFPPEIHRRYEQLAEKARHGELTLIEQQELDELLGADSVIALLKSKARRSLARLQQG